MQLNVGSQSNLEREIRGQFWKKDKKAEDTLGKRKGVKNAAKGTKEQT